MRGTWERAGAAANGKEGAEGDATAVIAEVSPRRDEIRRPTPRPIPIAAPDLAPSASHPETDINGAVLGRHTHATTFTSHSSLSSTAVSISLELPPTSYHHTYVHHQHYTMSLLRQCPGSEQGENKGSESGVPEIRSAQARDSCPEKHDVGRRPRNIR